MRLVNKRSPHREIDPMLNRIQVAFSMMFSWFFPSHRISRQGHSKSSQFAFLCPRFDDILSGCTASSLSERL